MSYYSNIVCCLRSLFNNSHATSIFWTVYLKRFSHLFCTPILIVKKLKHIAALLKISCDNRFKSYGTAKVFIVKIYNKTNFVYVLFRDYNIFILMQYELNTFCQHKVLNIRNIKPVIWGILIVYEYLHLLSITCQALVYGLINILERRYNFRF